MPQNRSILKGSASTTLGNKRLLELAAFLHDKVPEKAFRFDVPIEFGSKAPLEAIEAGGGCGTVACAVGWAPACFPQDAKWLNPFIDFDPANPGTRRIGAVTVATSRREKVSEAAHYKEWSMLSEPWARRFFSLTKSEVSHLFVPNHRGAPDPKAGPKTVAKHIRKFVRVRRKAMREGRPVKFTSKGAF